MTEDLNVRVRQWMVRNSEDFETSTELAENAANEFDLYEDKVLYKIPEWVFEISEQVLPTT